MGHPNEAVIRKGYEAFSKGDIETLQNEVLTDDIVWHFPGRNPLSGDYKGISEVLGFFGQLGERSGGTFQATLEDVFANDERGVGPSNSPESSRATIKIENANCCLTMVLSPRHSPPSIPAQW